MNPGLPTSKAAGYSALRRGRTSLPGATYFITIVTEARTVGLLVQSSGFHQLGATMQNEGRWELHALQVMPEHMHLLFRLGNDDSLSRCLRTFKGRGSVILRSQGLKWQRGAYHDHRLRDDESISRYLRYMLLNPYASGLVAWDQVWDGWYCSPATQEWFYPTTLMGRPHQAWMKESDILSLQSTKENGSP